MNSIALYTQRLAQLVAKPSVSSVSPTWDMGNRDVIDLLAGWLYDLGFAVDIQGIPGKPNKANLIATRGSGPGGLVLSGHTDTVPYDENRWQQDPFSLKEQGGKLFGLGATDMKGFFPTVLAACDEFANTPFEQPLIVLATADEESSMSGARLLADTGLPKARYAVIGEPTGLKPIYMHKGIMMEAIRIQGLAGHSSNPSLGLNALEAMQMVMTELLAFRRDMQEKYRNPGFEVDVPTLNLGHIHGGDNPNRICGHCELHFDLRPLPGMDIDSLRAEVTRRILPIEQTTGTSISVEPLFESVPPFQESHDSPLLQSLEKLSGYAAESVAFATEAPFLKSLGMQTMVFGPGSIDQAHQPNEFIDLQQIEPAIFMLKQLVQQFCVQKQPLIHSLR
ncbi:acetylornithine deacetylase [Aurantivibrio plasticivorans]